MPVNVGKISIDEQTVSAQSKKCLWNDNQKRDLSDFAVVGFEQAAEALDTDNLTRIALMFWGDDLIDSLMHTAGVVVFHKFRQDVTQLFFG